MKLQEFVSETLKEIIAGVKEAQTYAKDNGAAVNERIRGAPCDPKPITFDVAVTSTDASENEAGAGIFVAALGLGVRDKSDTLNSCVSRVRFDVLVRLPDQPTK